MCLMCWPQASRPADGRGQRRRHPVLRRHRGHQEAGVFLHRQRAAATGLDNSTGTKSQAGGRDGRNRLDVSSGAESFPSSEFERAFRVIGSFRFREPVRGTSARLKPPLSTTQQMMWITDNNTRGIFFKCASFRLSKFFGGMRLQSRVPLAEGRVRSHVTLVHLPVKYETTTKEYWR